MKGRIRINVPLSDYRLLLVLKINKKLKTVQRKQNTIQEIVSFSGLGVHTGKEVTMRFCPADINTGIVFKRVDLPGQPSVPATVDYVCDTNRSTTIGRDKVMIHTVEHVLAAVFAFEIDNLIIEVSNVEPPIADGSSFAFAKMLEEAGRCPQNAVRDIVKIDKPIYWSEGEIHLVALPHDCYRMSYTLSYAEPSVLRAQFHSMIVNEENFRNELSPCRTFSKYEEVSMLMDRGLIKGGSLDNAVIIKGDAVFSKEGLHFPNEMVRHKMLDMVGDFSLVGIPFMAHIIAIRAGHASNFELAKAIYQYITENT